MLFPYVYIQTLEKNLSKQLEMNNNQLQGKLSDRNLLNETNEKITLGNKIFNNQINSFIIEYDRFYKDLYNIIYQSNNIVTQNDFITEKKCEIAKNDIKAWISCNLNHKSINIINKINETLSHQIVFPLNNLNASKYHELKTNLKPILDNIQQKLYNLNYVLTNSSVTSNESIKYETTSILEEIKKTLIP